MTTWKRQGPLKILELISKNFIVSSQYISDTYKECIFKRDKKAIFIGEADTNGFPVGLVRIIFESGEIYEGNY